MNGVMRVLGQGASESQEARGLASHPSRPLEAECLASLCILAPHHPCICFCHLHLFTLFPDQVTTQLTRSQARTRRFPQRSSGPGSRCGSAAPPAHKGREESAAIRITLRSPFSSPSAPTKPNQTAEGSGKEEEPQGTGQHIPES